MSLLRSHILPPSSLHSIPAAASSLVSRVFCIQARARADQHLHHLPLLALLLLPLAAPAEALESIIENFKATLQRHPNGRVKTQLTADKATLAGEKSVAAENVRIFFLNDKGHIESVLESDTVTVDVETQRGLCPNLVSFEQHATEPSPDAPSASKDPATEGFRLEGTYVEWLGDQNQIVVHSNAVITLFREGTSLVKGWNN